MTNLQSFLRSFENDLDDLMLASSLGADSACKLMKSTSDKK
jgi:hypothetical protein